MNFLRFDGQAVAGAETITLGDIPMTLPQLQEPATGALVLGVRPEHVTLSDSAPLKARIEAAEYLGTTQIVTLSTPHGTVKARTPSSVPAKPGDLTGLALAAPRLSLFDATTGRALRTAANAGVHHG
jgi:multiple sugar transport system ATP-binding protein